MEIKESKSRRIPNWKLPRKAKTKRMKKEWRKSTEVTEHSKKKKINKNKKLEMQAF